MSRLGVNLWNKPRKLLFLSGYAYPGETLTAPAGTTYAWTVGGVSRGTAQTLVLTVYDIGLFVGCSVDGKTCQTQLIWHPNQINNVKGFFWAAKNAIATLGNNYTDDTRSITTNRSILFNSSGPTSLSNGKLYYYEAAYGSTLGWYTSPTPSWVLEEHDVNGDVVFTDSSTSDVQYPWQATWTNGTTFTLTATTVDVLATNNVAVTGWKEIITNTALALASAANCALYDNSTLATPTLKFDNTDYFSIPFNVRNAFVNQSYGYIFAGAKDTNLATAPTDATHGIVSINRTTSFPKISLVSRKESSGVFQANSSPLTTLYTAAAGPNNTNYNVLTNESLWIDGILNLRINGSTVATSSFEASSSNSNLTSSYIGAETSNSLSNFNGNITAVIFATDKLSDTDRNRIERFIGLLGGVNIQLV